MKATTLHLLALVALALASGCASQPTPVYQANASSSQSKPGVEPSNAEYPTPNIPLSDRYFYVTGEVVVPGPKPYVGATTLLDALSSAGGGTDKADLKRLVIRHSNGSVEYH